MIHGVGPSEFKVDVDPAKVGDIKRNLKYDNSRANAEVFVLSPRE